MGDDLETLSKEHLTRLAQYFDEAVTYPRKYKRVRVALPRQALRGNHAPIRTDEDLGTSVRKSSLSAPARRLDGNVARLVDIVGKHPT
jgi:hypothetical protein